MAARRKNPPPAPLPATYEAALAELETLVQRLESAQTPLDELLAGYERGAALLALCKSRLATVEEQIRVLEGSMQAPALRTWSADAPDESASCA